MLKIYVSRVLEINCQLTALNEKDIGTSLSPVISNVLMVSMFLLMLRLVSHSDVTVTKNGREMIVVFLVRNCVNDVFRMTQMFALNALGDKILLIVTRAGKIGLNP